MAKILITESIHAVGPELMRAAGHQLVFADRDQEVIRREIVDADAVIVRIVELPRTLLETAKQLKIVSKHGVGAFSELYDGDPPHEAHGAISSACSTAALLRVYYLMDKNKKEEKK